MTAGLAWCGKLHHMSEFDRIPVTVLGGWLGAGKTTMVNRILAAATERMAVIVNDVGKINVDAELIRANNAEDGGVIELTNGCVCCKVGDDLYATLAELGRREPAPDRIVLEASGVAETRQVASFLDHPRVTIDAIIALVDPNNFAYRSSGPPYGSLMRAQLAGADLVVATKLDLLAEHEHRATLDDLRQFTKAQIVAAEANPAWLQAVILGAHDNPEHEPAADSTAHVSTHAWRPNTPPDAAAVRAALRGSGLLRAKGSIMTTEGPLLVHLAGERVTFEELEPEVEPLNAIVLIGGSSEQVEAVAHDLDQAQAQDN